MGAMIGPRCTLSGVNLAAGWRRVFAMNGVERGHEIVGDGSGENERRTHIANDVTPARRSRARLSLANRATVF